MKANAPLPDLLPHAESRLLKTRADLDQFESVLYNSALPPHFWHREIRKCVQFVESRYSKAQRDYHRALTVQPVTTPAGLQPGVQAEAESPPPDPTPLVSYETIEVRLQDGLPTFQITGAIPECWFNGTMATADTEFRRQVIFPEGVVPDHYLQIMRRHGIATEPLPYVLYLKYLRDAYFAIRRQEQESQSQLLVEGEPIQIWVLL